MVADWMAKTGRADLATSMDERHIAALRQVFQQLLEEAIGDDREGW